MNLRNTILYKRLMKKYIDFKLEYRIKAHERDIDHLKSKIEVHEEVLKVLNNRKVKL